MFQRKIVKTQKRLVWRMSAAHPEGELVTPASGQARCAKPAETHARGYHASSLDLSDGADIREAEMSTLPGELIEGFTKAGK